MEPRFTQNYRLRASDFDRRLKLSPTAVLGLFQDAAGQHADELGVGFDSLLSRQLLWVIVKMRFQVLHDPKLYDRVCIETWPLPPRKVGFQREYRMIDADGKTLVRGSSEYVLIHSEKRKIMRMPDIYPEIEFAIDEVFDDRTVKVPAIGDAGSVRAHMVVPGFSTIDMNQHVNNAKYADFVLDAVDPTSDETVDTFQMDYHREVRENEELAIIVRRLEDERTILAEGHDSAEHLMFSCKIGLR